jgi:dolichol-phosphate mannosyltransferase
MPPTKFTPIINEIIKMFHFGFVGGLMVILNIGIIYFFTNILGIYYLISAILSYQLLLLLSFSLNEKLTFKSITIHTLEKKWHRFVSYYLVSLSSMILNILILFLLTEYGNVFYLTSSIIASFLVFFWNFFINKNVTWSEKHVL